jgi:hypothetical protein
MSEWWSVVGGISGGGMRNRSHGVVRSTEESRPEAKGFETRSWCRASACPHAAEESRPEAKGFETARRWRRRPGCSEESRPEAKGFETCGGGHAGSVQSLQRNPAPRRRGLKPGHLRESDRWYRPEESRPEAKGFETCWTMICTVLRPSQRNPAPRRRGLKQRGRRRAHGVRGLRGIPPRGEGGER